MRIKISGKEYLFFDDIYLTLTLDAIASTFSFVARFNSDNPDHKELFRPLQYQDVEILNNEGKTLLTGTLTGYKFDSNAAPNAVSLSGYSKAGILEDCPISLNNFPLEHNNSSLREIANKLTQPFNIKLIVEASASAVVDQIYEKTSAGAGESIKSYLTKLCAQRNIVLSHDALGNVVMYRPDINATPKYKFDNQNSQSMSLSVNGQQLFSDVFVIRQPSEDNPNVKLSDKASNRLVGKPRPSVSVLSSGKETDTSKAADNKLASQLKAISLNVSLNKRIEIKPSDIVEIINPEIFIYQSSKFMVEKVSFKENSSSSTTEISLVLPETYSGANPKNIFA